MGVQKPQDTVQKQPHDSQRVIPSVRIKRLFYSAHKAFKGKWNSREPAIGFAVDKISKYETEPAMQVVIGNGVSDDGERYIVQPKKLLEAIQRKGCYNKNGKYLCGYLSKPALNRLARETKEALPEVDHTNQARYL